MTIKRRLDTEENRRFWESAQRASRKVQLMLPYKRGGRGEHPIDVIERLKIAQEIRSGLELSATDVEKIVNLLSTSEDRL